MSFKVWFAYVSVASIATLSPGMMVMLVMTRSLEHGWRRTIFSALGNAAGLLILGIFSISGLTLILMASESAFVILKYAGAFYLIYLGYKQFYLKSNVESITNAEKAVTGRELFFEALTVALTNPKAWIFLNALLPQFIDSDKSVIPQFSLLIVTLLLLSVSCLLTYAALASRLKYRISGNVFNKVTGSTFFVLGIVLIVSAVL